MLGSIFILKCLPACFFIETRNVFMLSKLWGRKRLIVPYLLGMALISMVSLTPLLNSANAQAGSSNTLPQVKVLIITMFPPETQAWLSKGTWKLVSRPIGAIDADDAAVYCQISESRCNGIYLTIGV
jgi:purine nucleoside permease